MTTRIIRYGVVVSALAAMHLLYVHCEAQARGFGGGGFRGGGGFSGYRGGSFSGFSGSRGGGFSANRAGGFSAGGFSGSGSRSFEGYSGARGGFAGGSYDRSFEGSRGGSIDASGSFGAAYGPRGGFAAGGTRDVTATGPQGRTYSGSSQFGAARGPWGGFAAGGSRYGAATGPRGAFAGGSQWGAAGMRFPTDAGLSRFSAQGAAGGAFHATHSTQMWSHDDMAARAGGVRAGFYHYNSFTTGWFTGHPGAWAAAGWDAGTAWNAAAWPSLANWMSISSAPVYYDYGNTVVYQGDDVYVNGTDAGTADEYAQQAGTLANQGRDAQPSQDDQWQSLGVFAMLQGDEKDSNTMFQLAVDQGGIIRGNYYNAVMDMTTPVYGSVDPQSQRAAWSVGKNKNTVFETGIDNLTKDQAPMLVHMGQDRTQQWLLVRMQQQDTQSQPGESQPDESQPDESQQ